MCGIFGVVGKQIEKEIAEYCMNTLAHRGPDGSGLWQENNVTLCHRRLSILDLSEKGKQPMFYAGDRFVITFNGEIYNFIEIRKDLIAKGYGFQSDSDTEVVLAAFTEWKEKCLDKFNGMWAFAIWDREKKELFLARDRFGIKPLYYTKLDESGAIAFASEMKALAPVMNDVSINYNLVRDTNRIMSYETSNECVIENIHRIPAGYFGVINSSGMSIKEWWNTLDHLVSAPVKYEEQVEKFRELFLDACKLRMRSDVTIGTALSGGLDSSATISAMSYLSKQSHDTRMSQEWQHAFVAAFPNTCLDESEYAKEVTKHLEIDCTILDIDPLKYWGNINDSIYLFEEIYYTSPIPMMAIYGAERKSGTIVTIDGHGADELLGGYPGDYIHALHDAKYDIKSIRNVMNTYMNTFPEYGNHALRKSEMEIFLNYKIRDMLGRNKKIDKLYDDKKRWKSMDRLNKVLYNSTHKTILPTLLRNYDRYSMANGVEIRMPFMDYRIVEFAFSIGWQSKIQRGYSKVIIRDAMSPFMPEKVTWRRSKIGFNTPIVEWMQGGLKEWFTDVISSNDFIHSNVIDGRTVKEMVVKVITDENASYSQAEQTWTAMMPYLWEKHFYQRVRGR